MNHFFTNRYHHIKRYHEIINIISKHGFGYLLELTGLSNALHLPWKKHKSQIPPTGMAKRLCLVLEELGPTFIKLGQILSTRHDLLPEIYISQLEVLQDQVLPVDFDQIKRIIEAELSLPLKNLFLFFCESPIASASIGQVHEAFLLTGEHVVVKIQKSGVDKVVQTDLQILHDVAGFLEERTEWGKVYNIKKFVDEVDPHYP